MLGYLATGSALSLYRVAALLPDGERRRPLRLRARLVVAWGMTGAFLRGGRPGVLVWLLKHSG